MGRCLVLLLACCMLALAPVACGGQQAEAPQEGEKAPDEEPQPGGDAQRESTEPATPEPPPATVPDYSITKEEETTQGSTSVIVYSLSTDATSEKDLRAITVELRAENPDRDAVAISFYPNEPTAETSGASYAFASAEAARAVLGGGYEDRDIEKIMDEDGLLVISVEDTIREATEAMEAEMTTG